MADVQITVADLYRIIGEKEIVIHSLTLEKLQLQQQVALLTAAVQGAQKAAAQEPSDGKQ